MIPLLLLALATLADPNQAADPNEMFREFSRHWLSTVAVGVEWKSEGLKSFLFDDSVPGKDVLITVQEGTFSMEKLIKETVNLKQFAGLSRAWKADPNRAAEPNGWN